MLSAMKKVTAVSILILLIFSFLPGLFADDPNGEPEERGVYFAREPNTSLHMSYDGETVQISESVRIMHRGPREHVMLTFSSGDDPEYEPRTAFKNGHELHYQIFDNTNDRNILKDVDAPEASGNQDFLDNSLNYTFPTDNQNWQYKTLIYEIEVPAEQIMEASGTFTDTFTLTLYTRRNVNNLNNIEVIDSKDITLSIHAPGIIQTALTSPGADPDFADADYFLDFGVLEPGKEASAELVVKASTGYSVSVESSNKGYMHLDSQQMEAKVPYAFEFNSTEYDLTQEKQPVQLLTNTSPTGEAGERHGIDIIIGDFGIVPAGTYRDVLSFTISAD